LYGCYTGILTFNIFSVNIYVDLFMKQRSISNATSDIYFRFQLLKEHNFSQFVPRKGNDWEKRH